MSDRTISPSERQQLELIRKQYLQINEQYAVIADLARTVDTVFHCPWKKSLDDQSLQMLGQAHALIDSQGIYCSVPPKPVGGVGNSPRVEAPVQQASPPVINNQQSEINNQNGVPCLTD